MIDRRPVSPHLPQLRGGACCFALLGSALLCAGAAHAQQTPYQSPQREVYGSGPGQQPLARGGRLEPRLELAVQYANNVGLAANAQDQINTGGVEVAPGIYADGGGGLLPDQPHLGDQSIQ